MRLRKDWEEGQQDLLDVGTDGMTASKDDSQVFVLGKRVGGGIIY